MISILVLLVLSSIYDIRLRKVPCLIMSVGSSAGVIFSVCRIVANECKWWECATALIPGFFLLIMAFITGKIGYGDGWMLLVVGLYLGYRQCVGAFMISLFLASGASVLMLLLRKVSRNSSLPYIPFLTAGVFLILRTPIS